MKFLLGKIENKIRNFDLDENNENIPITKICKITFFKSDKKVNEELSFKLQ